ncbi:MAG: serine hydrolase domain-containing protein [bacterium]
MTATAERTLQSELHDLVVPLLERWKVPGIAIATWEDGRVRSAAFGKANLEAGYDVTPDTMFQIGSITKVFTATAFMQLVDGWQVDLDAPVTRYLPDFRLSVPEATEMLRVRHLLTHHTGFWGDDFRDYGEGDDAVAKGVTAIAGIRQLTMPGENWAYCNGGFKVLGAIMERFAGKPFEEIVRDQVFKPLGLDRSTFRADEAVTFPVAVGYNTLTTPEPVVARPYAIPRSANPAGAIIGTVGELLKFAEFHLGDGVAGGRRVLSAGALAEMQKKQVNAANMAPAWGLGWWLQDASGTKTIGHGGSTNGHRANLVVVPERRLAIASLTNGSNGTAVNRAVERHLMAKFGVPRTDPQEGHLPEAALQNFAGTYYSPGGDMTITAEGGRLTIDTVARNALTGAEYRAPVRHAEPIGDLEFVVKDTDMEGSRFDFMMNSEQTVRFLRFGGRLYEPVGA